MKFLIILALVTLAAAEWKPKTRNQLKQIRLDCMKIQNMSQELKDQIARLEYPENDQTKEFILCGARGSQLWDDTNGWNSDRIIQLFKSETSLSVEEMRKAIEDCLDTNSQGNALKDWAFRNYLCMTQSSLKDAFENMMKKLE